MQICELLPNTARIADKIAIVRSVTSPLGEHGLANHYLLTGYKPSPVLEYPELRRGRRRTSAAAGRRCRPTSPCPTTSRRPGPGSSAPRAGRSPSAATRRSPTSASATSTSTPASRPAAWSAGASSSRSSTASSSRSRPSRRRPTPSSSRRIGWSRRRRRSRRSTCRDEKPAVRARYGPRTLGQSCLLARRLVERGVAVRDRQQPRLGHARRPRAAAEGGLRRGEGRRRPDPDVRPGVRRAGRRPERARPARRDAGDRDGRVRPHAEAEHRGRPRPLAARLQRRAGRRRRQGRPGRSAPATASAKARPTGRSRRRTWRGRSTRCSASIPTARLHTADGRPVQVNQGGKVVRELLA